MEQEIKEPEVRYEIPPYANTDLISSAYNVIAAAECFNPMTVEETDRVRSIKSMSLMIIETCIKELYDYTIPQNDE